MEVRQRCACWPATRRWISRVHRTTKSLHALLSTPLCVLTLMLGYGASTALSAPLSGSSVAEGSDYMDSRMASSHIVGFPEEGEPGFRYSFHSSASQKHMYEGVIICLLAATAFIGLVVWVLKSNFEERQTRRMRREASLRDRNSNLSPLMPMTPDSEES